MLFNRLVDWTLDQRNPRTATRHQLISRPVALLLLGLSSAAFVAAAATINRTTLLLSPLALAIIFFYSLTKRFTAASHFFLGGRARRRASGRLDRGDRPADACSPPPWRRSRRMGGGI